MSDWPELFELVTHFLADCERHKNEVSLERAEYICDRLENVILTVKNNFTVIMESKEQSSINEYLLERLTLLSEQLTSVELVYWREKVLNLSDSDKATFNFEAPEILKNGRKQGMQEMDPISISMRWHLKTKRRPYSVPGPNSLWHIGVCITHMHIHTVNIQNVIIIMKRVQKET